MRTSPFEFLRDGDRFDHLVDLLQLAIQLGGADADAAGIQHGIGPAVHDQTAAGGEGGQVAMPPDIRVARK